MGHWLFELAGGISYHSEEPIFKTHLGGISWAFETPLHVPGSYLMTLSNTGPCIWGRDYFWGLLLLVIATLMVVVTVNQIFNRIRLKDKNWAGQLYWRIIILILGLVFIPVPVEMTFTYNVTVLC